jgi:hypothetical protein
VDAVWIAEEPEIIGFRLLRGVRGGSRNAFTAGNGYHLGATLGTWEEPGDRPRARVPGTRGRRGATAKPGNWPGLVRRGRGKAPHLIHGGPCLILPGRNVFFQDRHAGDRQNASRDDPGHGRERRRGPHAAAPRPEAAGAEAAVADGQTQGGGERPRPGSGTISSAPGP